MSDDSKPKEAKQKRTRSPAYPAIDLQTAIARAAVLWTKINRHAAPLDSIAAYWGYDPKSSKAMSEAAAMIKYGILSDEGIGSNRTIKLTDAGIKLSYNPDKDSADYLTGLKKTALLPAIHQELWERYQGNLPDDAVIKRYLVVDKKFNEQYVDEFISQFRRTIEFAKLGIGDSVVADEGGGLADGLETGGQAQVPSPPAVGKVTTITKQTGKKVLAQYSIPIGANEATITFSGEELTAGDFDALTDYVAIFKKQFERKQKSESSHPLPPPKPAFPEPPFVARRKSAIGETMVKIIGQPWLENGKWFFQADGGIVVPSNEIFYDSKK